MSPETSNNPAWRTLEGSDFSFCVAVKRPPEPRRQTFLIVWGKLCEETSAGGYILQGKQVWPGGYHSNLKREANQRQNTWVRSTGKLMHSSKKEHTKDR